MAVEFHELSGKRTGTAADFEGEVEFNMHLQHQIVGSNFAIRMLAQVNSEAFEASVVAAGLYQVEGAVTVDEEFVTRYTAETGAAQLYPYLREAVQTIVGRITPRTLILPPLAALDIAINEAPA